MKDILEDIVAHKRMEVEQFKEVVPERGIHAKVERIIGGVLPSLKAALAASPTGIIAEFKRRSPSKGWINEHAEAADVPLAYQENGASAISILTDKTYFGGDDVFITSAREAGVTLPVLYKNFIVDEYQLFQARLCGASAVLLIASVLPLPLCRSLMDMAHELGLEVLMELHSDKEIDYAGLMPDVCGVNNRNLGTFTTDINRSFSLAGRLPAELCKISESGISSPRAVARLRQAGYQGFLIGECFMKTDNPGEALRDFIKELETYAD